MRVGSDSDFAGEKVILMSTLPSISLAAVFRAPGEPLTLERFPIPSPRGSEAIVRIKCVTICGSDLHSYFGRRHLPMPSILGHEMVGEIAAAGPMGARDYRGTLLKIGDRVTWSMVWSCGRCFYCMHGLRPKCERLMKFGHEEISAERTLIGGMAEYCQLPDGTAIFRVADAVSDRVASPANCATATVAAVFRNAGPVTGEVVLVHGAGMLGQTACALASSMGAKCVIVIDPDQSRRELALRFGANVAIDTALPSAQIAAQINDLSKARGADVGLELAGYPESIELGLGLLRMGGRFVMAGSTFPSRPVHFSAEQLVRRMIRITGVHNYAPEDLEKALAFLADKGQRYPFEELVGASYPLSEVNAAIAFAENERPPRVALIP
jgi:alcohol dehydrogenase